MTHREGVEAVQLSERMIRSLVPVFMGLDALAECGDDAPAQSVVDHAFEVLAQIGYDQSAGSGLFASTAVRPEVPYLAALKSPPIAKAYAGTASLEGLGDTSQMLSSIQSLASRVDADRQQTAMGELFSVVADGRIEDIKENKGETHELVGIYERVRGELIAICGDRRVGEYRRKDLQRYVDQISWLPPEASSQKGFSYCDVAQYIEANKAVGGRGLAANTIKQGRVSYIKAIIALGCEDADIRNRVDLSP